MDYTPVSIDKWRDYFSGADSDIFEIIEHAIIVAAFDCPYDFKQKRDRIAEMLFTCKVAKCLGCNRVELSVPNDDCLDKIDGDGGGGGGGGDKCRNEAGAGGSKDSKESKVNSSGDEEEEDDDDDGDHREVMVMNVNQVCNQSYEDAEALNDEIEEENQLFGEVLRIKEIVDNSEEKSDELLFDSLRRLQLMRLNVEVLKATEIGKSVNSLRKRKSKEIRNLVRTLIEDWKRLVDEWVTATTAIAGAEVATETAKTSADEDEPGLPSPPLDEGAFFATPTSMELSQFFDGMDEDGNLRTSGEFNKNRENGRMRRPPTQKLESPNAPGNKINQEFTLKKEAPPSKPNVFARPKPFTVENVMKEQRNTKPPNVNNVMKEQRSTTVQKKPSPPQRASPPQREKLNCVDNKASESTKLEAAKRKLHERYQEAQNAKKQRTIQVVELHDLPKQSLVQRNGVNNNRRWVQGQR